MSQSHNEMVRELYLDCDTSDVSFLVDEKAIGSSYPQNKYQRRIKLDVWVDVYDVLKAFNVTNPATQHAIKKLLAGGQRGHKDLLQDLNEAHASISRAIELEL
jgi:hypothetical protein